MTASPTANSVTPSPIASTVARDVVSRNVRKRHRNRQCARPHPVVGRIERGCRDAQPHLPRARCRMIDLLDAENLRTADLVEPDCLHDDFLS